MPTALREVLAELDMKVKGLGNVEAANAAVDRYLATVTPAVAQIERLRVAQQEANEMASRLAARIRKLQKAEGDNEKQIDELRLAMARAKEAAKSFGDQADTLRRKQEGAAQATPKTASAFKDMRGAMGLAAGALGAVVVATAGVRRALGAVGEAIFDVVAQGDGLNDASVRIGISAQALQEWRYVAERSGIEADAFEAAIRRLTKTATGSGAQALRKLGVATKDSSGELRTQEAIFSDTITALAGVRNQTMRAALAQKLFGKSGAQLLTLIDEGPEGIDRLRQRFSELGGGLSGDLVANAAAADDALVDLRTAWTSLRASLVANVVPVLATVVDKLATWIGQAAEFVRTSSIMQTVLAGLAVAAGAFAIFMIPLAAPILAVAGALAGLVLIVEDVVTAFRGGDSVLGSLVERVLAAFGVTTTFTGAVDQLGVAWDRAIASALSGLATLLETATGVRAALGLSVDLAGATAARGAANLAAARAEQGAAAAAALERIRLANRVNEAVIPRFAPAGAGAGQRVTQRNIIRVDGARDPDAVAREVDRRLGERLRAAADVLPEAEEDDDG